MEVILAVVVAAVLAGGAGWALGVRSGSGGRSRELVALAEELRRGGVKTPGPEDAPAIAELRRVLAAGWAPRGGSGDEPPGESLLRRVTTYLERSVSQPLARGLELGGPALRAGAREALDALDDLAFHAEARPVADRALDNLTRVVQEVIREYASEFQTPVRLRAPDTPVRAALDAEAFKDALYMVLVNAGRFGGSEPVEVSLEVEGRDTRVLVRDRGPGFLPEALERALEPFYSTEPGSLGLGLTHVRQVVLAHGGDLRLRNREEGGGEVEILLPRG
jgi:signal transduction histidine kinase